MPIFQPPVPDYLFLLNELYPLDDFRELPGFSEITPELLEQILTEGGKFVANEWQPLNANGDKHGCRLDVANGTVTTPDGFKSAYQAYCDAGWGMLSVPEQFGGQGLPNVLAAAMDEMSNSANMSLTMYPVLNRAAIEALIITASEEQKQAYIPNMVSGKWAGSMNLTEPHCGTDLGLIRTRAELQTDGSYRITGTKIFITAGEHDLAENIIHLVLARLTDAPGGIKGLSMFIVPKYRINEDGSLGQRNAVRCIAIEEKIGIHGSATCTLNYDDAVGYLVGEPNRGMRAMFVMMNIARLGAAIQGLALSEVAYQNAVAYCRERLQGRALPAPARPDKSADPIIVHPDVRRMLLTVRAFNEGARALIVHAALMVDIAHIHPDERTRRDAEDFLALMTPVIKAHFTDQGFNNTDLALQCFGGYGYIRESGMEQFLRDVRITKIYEGANGIQALDLVFRKLLVEDGRCLKQFFEPAGAFIEETRQDRYIGEKFALPLAAALEKLIEVTSVMRDRVIRKPAQAAAAATDYLRLFGITALAFEWSKIARLAFKRLDMCSENREAYQDKIRLGHFYMQWLLPEVTGLRERILGGTESLLEFELDSY